MYALKKLTFGAMPSFETVATAPRKSAALAILIDMLTPGWEIMKDDDPDNDAWDILAYRGTTAEQYSIEPV